jgi:hypothetical protein
LCTQPDQRDVARQVRDDVRLGAQHDASEIEVLISSEAAGAMTGDLAAVTGDLRGGRRDHGRD